MSTQTTHLNLDLREAADIFNPLSTNANFESLDNIIYDIQTKGGVPTYTTTASANLLKLSQNPTPNVTVFKFVAAGDANTWSYQETVNNIVSLDGNQKTVKAGEMYVAWVNAANSMVVIAWPDVVNAQTFDGKGPSEWATKVQLEEVNQTASNATQTAQAAATVANNALEVAQAAGVTVQNIYQNATPSPIPFTQTFPEIINAKMVIITFVANPGNPPIIATPIVRGIPTGNITASYESGTLESGSLKVLVFTVKCTINWDTGEITLPTGAFVKLPTTSSSASQASFYVTRIDIVK